jgi:hypothetical protein
MGEFLLESASVPRVCDLGRDSVGKRECVQV